MNESSGGIDIGQLERWKDERPRRKLFERNARKKIVSAIQRDVERGQGGKIGPGDVLRKVGGSLKKLGAQRDRVGIIAQHEDKDGVSVSQIIREPEAWVAKEVDKKTGRVYTQARVGINGSTSLTLDFKQLGPERNPQIVDSYLLPEATTVTFNLLVGAVTRKIK